MRTRLLLGGALLPAIGMAISAVIATETFESHVRADLDQRLLAQAAVERESLFDGPGGRPHLHGADATDGLSEMIAARAIYDGEGALLVSAGGDFAAHVPPPLGPGPWWSKTPGGSRQLLVEAMDHGRRYFLQVVGSTIPAEAAIGSFRATIWWFAALVTFILVMAQVVIAFRLARRFERLMALLPRLFDTPPAAIPRAQGHDEIAALQNALATTSERVAATNEARERFVAEAAHELRTPLSLLRTSIDLALRRERPPDELKAALETARGDVVSLSVLADRLLDLERLRQPQVLERHPTDITALVRDVVRRTGDALVRSDVSAEVNANVDGEMLRQALANLVENAQKFAPGRAVVVAHEPAERELRLTVSDAGPPIAPELRRVIFEPFHRLARDKPGAGLGLAIVSAIAAAHGGRCEVEPVVDAAGVEVGNRFRIVLPEAAATT